MKNYNKYHNKKIVENGVVYDSHGEYKRYLYLKSLEENGVISDLKHHVKIELLPKVTTQKIVHLKTKDKIVEHTEQTARYYEADFTYTVKNTNEKVVEDFKGRETDVFKLKSAIFFYRYGKRIKVVKQYNEPVI